MKLATNSVTFKKIGFSVLLTSIIAIVIFLQKEVVRYSNQNLSRRRYLFPFLESIEESFVAVIPPPQNKTILIWNSPERIETASFGIGHRPFIEHGCEFVNCIVFDNPSSLPLEKYDAILVHMHELWQTKMPIFRRQNHQRLVFVTQESPASMSSIDVTSMRNTFNWTMSYRFNSDIRLQYGRILPRTTAPKNLKETTLLMESFLRRSISHRSPAKKNFKSARLVAWMVSACKTDGLRESYVRELSRHIPVDIYGRCGNLSCPRNETHWISEPSCYDMLETNYKFYLSFENSICTDYVTEKFFEILRRQVVPVVYGGADYSRIAPVHSYIDALRYSPQQLAEYLVKLDHNETLYHEYFWWKDHYTVEAGVEQMARRAFCDLCKKLHLEEGQIKYYKELETEWEPKNQCFRYQHELDSNIKQK